MRLNERTKLVKKIKHKTFLLQASWSKSCNAAAVFVMLCFVFIYSATFQVSALSAVEMGDIPGVRCFCTSKLCMA
jgi:hypothetical protein